MEQRLLVVDDSEACGHTLELAILGCGGMGVERYTNGAGAWSALHERGGVYAAIITDIQLDTASGYDLIRLARTCGSSRIVIIAVSGSTDTEAGQKALDAGANAFFRKPFSPFEIRTRLESLLAEA
jgi:DNA-binding response OmpR family regulator